MKRILTLWCIQATSQGEEAAEQVGYPWPWSGHCHVPALLSAQALGSPNVTGKEGPGSPEGTGKKEGRPGDKKLGTDERAQRHQDSDRKLRLRDADQVQMGTRTETQGKLGGSHTGAGLCS